MFRREPFREQHGEWPHKTHNRLHGLEQQQNGEVNRNDDEQTANERAHNEFTELFNRRAFLDVEIRDRRAGPPRASLL